MVGARTATDHGEHLRTIRKYFDLNSSYEIKALVKNISRLRYELNYINKSCSEQRKEYCYFSLVLRRK